MNKNSNTYIITYATILVVVVAAVLAFAAISLKPLQQENIKIEKMGAILTSIGEGGEADAAPEGKDKYIETEYHKFIVEAFTVNAKGERVDGVDAFKTLDNLEETFEKKEALPVFQAKLSDGQTLYVVPTNGKGLWGPVWGYVALKSDCDEIYGVVFDHKSETPGLGAEIANSEFESKFTGKRLFKDGVFQSVSLLKNVGDSNPYAVDAISGGTLTCNGVNDMIKNCLSDYVPFFQSVRAQQ